MRKGIVYKIFVYFLTFSFLFLMNEFPRRAMEAKERNLPIGEMVSRGEVKYESVENGWKKVEPLHFPIFQKVKIKTENGVAVIALANDGHIEVGNHCILSFDQVDQIHLSQGEIEFKIPSKTELNFKVGRLIVTKSHPLTAAKASLLVSPKSEGTIGRISIHSNGSATVKSIQGSLSILDNDQIPIARLSSRDSVTIPTITINSTPKVMSAQAGGTGRGLPSRMGVGAAGAGVEEALISPWVWGGIGLAVLAIGGITWAFFSEDKDDDDIPLCP
jgi:hypothetical protein